MSKLKLTLAPSKAKKGGKPTQDLGPAVTRKASEYHGLALKKKTLEGQLEVLKENIVEYVVNERNSDLKIGKVNTTVPLALEGGHKLSVIWAEKFKALPVENRANLQEVFGEDYGRVIEERTEVKLVGNLAAIEKALGPKAMAALQVHLEIERTLCVRKGAYATAAEFYEQGDSDRGDALVELIDVTGQAPSLKCD